MNVNFIERPTLRTESDRNGPHQYNTLSTASNSHPINVNYETFEEDQ